jgi:hypothetical protein
MNDLAALSNSLDDEIAYHLQRLGLARALARTPKTAGNALVLQRPRRPRSLHTDKKRQGQRP